jgi:hypothetical protein
VWKTPTAQANNEGKMRLVVFGNSMFNQAIGFKHNMSNAVKKIYDNLKRRERLGQAVVVTIDDYLFSGV